MTKILNFINNYFAIILVIGLFIGIGSFSAKTWSTNQRLKLSTQAKTDSKKVNSAWQNLPPVSESDHIRGNLNAKVIIIEYSDFECPYCARFHPTLSQIMEEYGDDVAWVFRHFPLPSHSSAKQLAITAECISQIGGNEKFWHFIDTLYEHTLQNEGSFSDQNITAYIKEQKLDQQKMTECIENEEIEKVVTNMISSGGKSGVNGTPASFIISEGKVQEMVSGALPYTQFKTIVEKYL